MYILRNGFLVAQFVENLSRTRYVVGWNPTQVSLKRENLSWVYIFALPSLLCTCTCKFKRADKFLCGFSSWWREKSSSTTCALISTATPSTHLNKKTRNEETCDYLPASIIALTAIATSSTRGHIIAWLEMKKHAIVYLQPIIACTVKWRTTIEAVALVIAEVPVLFYIFWTPILYLHLLQLT